MSKTTTLDILRHGECEGGQLYLGSTDVLLTESGWRQMRNAIDASPAPWQQIITSPLQRCYRFATQLSSDEDLPLMVESRLRETDFGTWEGREVDEVWQTEKSAVIAWIEDPVAASPPEGETTREFFYRVLGGYNRIVNNYRGKRVLLVTHGGVIRMLLAHVLQMPLTAVSRFAVPHACLSRVEVLHTGNGDYARLVAHNLLT
ncbi:alpha-ribazole phosphatase family protein [Exilibacterium tricleocarpae]|uniref:Alpha-ribazole phosphatase family protein n=1 Tax=Exilibacterium tricleocarpae TaxID=2591008 RepID=A0A545U3E1_9GAMM|nr:alpha-ribazole phosphatase family protein [Exilibacterium tricleocarpae]TQV83989.1 alpha-ribazole phosphatase family protein [Exilibacterium tricleocarpae]